MSWAGDTIGLHRIRAHGCAGFRLILIDCDMGRERRDRSASLQGMPRPTPCRSCVSRMARLDPKRATVISGRWVLVPWSTTRGRPERAVQAVKYPRCIRGSVCRADLTGTISRVCVTRQRGDQDDILIEHADAVANLDEIDRVPASIIFSLVRSTVGILRARGCHG